MRDLEKELRQANFHRDRLAERLGLVEMAVVELEGALACDGDIDPEHWREHARHAMASALHFCRQATKTVQRAVPVEEREQTPLHDDPAREAAHNRWEEKDAAVPVEETPEP